MQASLLSFYMIALTRGLHYITSLVLLFLLTPFDFGVMAVVMAVIALMNSLSAFGVDSALISYQGDEEFLLDDAFSLEVGKGIFLAGSIIFLAPLIAIWLDEPILRELLSTMALAFICQSSKNIGLVTLRKKFDFKVIFQCEIAMAITSFIITIVVAYFYASPWAIAAGYLAGWLIYVLSSYLLCSYRPNISFNKDNMKALFSYSKWILVSAQINALIENGVNIFVGSHFGMSVLGQFERADMFTRKTTLQIGEVIWKVGLPSLSLRAKDSMALRDRYILIYRFICLVVFPAMAVVCIYMPVVMGMRPENDWQYFQDLVSILAVAGIFTILLTPASVLFQATRVPQVGFNIASIRLITIMIVIAPMIYFFEHLGAALSLLVGVIVIFPFSMRSVSRIINISTREHFLISLEYLAPCAVFLFLPLGDTSILKELIGLLFAVIGYATTLVLVSKTSRKRLKLAFQMIKSRL